ncbi:hypothetical protein FRC12_017109 [Ceratobasidium sp. 428]|nr:hypothetical protein FRC12_017109 [Ceratobasidium sp. 428]
MGALGAVFDCAGHEGPVKSISCSPDGRLFASGSNDCTLCIWDSASGRPIYGPLEGHESWVVSVDFSPDSKYIASGSSDGTVRIWDAGSGAMCSEPLVGSKRGVNEVAFTPDGNCLISAGMDGHIKIWDVRSLGITARSLEDQTTIEVRVLETEVASVNSPNRIVSQLDDQDGSENMNDRLQIATEPVADIISASVRRCFPQAYPVVCRLKMVRVQSPEEIVLRLDLRGCLNMTDQLDLTTCSEHPIFSGGFGDIYQAKLNDGAQVAIKTIRLYIGSTEQNQKLLKLLKVIQHAAHEMYAWSKCKHSNVQPLIGLVMFGGRIGMIAHWESNGDLPQYLKRHADTDRCVVCSHIEQSTQIAEGLAYLHPSGVIHGDLKGANILISQDGIAQLADFGNAKLQEYTLQFTKTSTRDALSSRWAAPELFEGKSCSYAADVYALLGI